MLRPGSTPAGGGEAELPLSKAILSQNTSCTGAGAGPGRSGGSCTGILRVPPSFTGLPGEAPLLPQVPGQAWPGDTPALRVPAPPAHLEADVPLLAAQAGQHEEDEGEEPREGNSHNGQRGGPGELAKGGAVCRDRRGTGSGQGAGGAPGRDEAVSGGPAWVGGHRMQGHIGGQGGFGREHSGGDWGSQHRCAPFASQEGWGAQEGPQSRGRTLPAACTERDRGPVPMDAGWQ